jgi:hypothetical protein
MHRFGVASAATALPFKSVAMCYPETSVTSTGLRLAVSRENSVWAVVSNQKILGRQLVYTLYRVFIV